ncbi:AAA family ATPase [Parasphingorhabdus cellanae]|uniref:AAA family ATPase n=1 Tax=Parasphingorhabdus cellanae TaxID=2806553 RepID=A0ABX7T3S9_9SPHN|nr:AAA family ATPase [Parasphingorhabdus cellanae]QTD56228.1 AAA family ATPase [Parasphingorhabdus cellanae]
MTSFLGHDKALRIFRQSFDKGTLHHAWILAGSKGIGKAGFAKQAAQFLLDSDSTANGKDFNLDNMSQSAQLLAAGSHPDFRLVQRGGKTDKEEKKAREEGLESLEEHELKRNISIAQIRNLQSLFATQASISRYRVVIIDAIDDLERGGANALLKNLEEPPKDTVFLLVSHTPERLLPTIRSRCQILRFDPLDDDQMRQALSALAPKLDQPELNALIAAGEGAPGKSLQYIDAGLAELESFARDIMRTGDKDNQIKNDLARKLSLKAATPRYHAFLSRAPSLIAQHIKAEGINSSDTLSGKAIDTWREASNLAAMAIPKALDNQAVIFRLGSLMGALAEPDMRA